MSPIPLVGRSLLVLLTVVLLAAAPSPSAQPGFGNFGSTLATSDFNGDGFLDLAVGVPSYIPGGAVDVIYGTADGLTADGTQRWTQNSPGIQDRAEGFDLFGIALASGDFDGDGFDDLAIGVPREDLEGLHPTFVREDVGAVHVLYGSAAGLTAARSQFAHRDTPGIEGIAQLGDNFGWALATGDFDGDGRDDLAVGVPRAWVDGVRTAGEVNVFYGSVSGLRVARNQRWSQNSPGIEGEAASGETFGETLESGDFDGDGWDDLAVGVPFDNVSGASGAGGLNVLYGSTSGLTATGNQLWTQDSPGVLDTAEVVDRFGDALAAGNFDGDGFDDLAVGVPHEDVFGFTNAGAVNVLYGSASGLTADGNQFWHQDSPGILDDLDGSDDFGESVAAGDFDGDGFDDLAVGVPQEDFGSISGAGAANVLYGTASGLTADGNQFWHQELDGLPDGLENQDDFGRAVASGDFDGDGFADLAVGVPGEDVQGLNEEGAVNVLYGTGAGLSAVGNQYWHQGLLVPPVGPNAEAPASVAGVSVVGASVWPNPASGAAVVAFALAAPAEVRLVLYDVLGRSVTAVAPGPLEAGPHRVALDVSALPPGVYVWRLRTGTRIESGRLTVAR